MANQRETSVKFTVESGAVWATRTGDPQDYIAEAGQTLKLDGPGWVVTPLPPRPMAAWRVPLL